MPSSGLHSIEVSTTSAFFAHVKRYAGKPDALLEEDEASFSLLD